MNKIISIALFSLCVVFVAIFIFAPHSSVAQDAVEVEWTSGALVILDTLPNISFNVTQDGTATGTPIFLDFSQAKIAVTLWNTASTSNPREIPWASIHSFENSRVIRLSVVSNWKVNSPVWPVKRNEIYVRLWIKGIPYNPPQ